MFGWIKKRKAYNMGRDIGAAITEEIETHITHRILPAGERFVEVFRERLDTVYDNPEVHPKMLVQVEWESFGENLADFAGHMKAELNVRTYKFDEIINAAGIRDVTDEYITKRISDVVEGMREKGAGMGLEAIAEIERREAAAAGKTA